MPLHKYILKMPPTSVAATANNNTSISLYPNPATSMVNLHLENTAQAILELSDMAGRVVMTKQVLAGDNSVTLNQPTGVYTARIMTNGQLLHVQKLQVNQ
jgi:hypothetical protein